MALSGARQTTLDNYVTNELGGTLDEVLANQALGFNTVLSSGLSGRGYEFEAGVEVAIARVTVGGSSQVRVFQFTSDTDVFSSLGVWSFSNPTKAVE